MKQTFIPLVELFEKLAESAPMIADVLYSILVVLIFCLAPALVLWLCRRYPWLDKLGPIIILYAMGIIIGNLPFKPTAMATIQDITTSAAVPLAIPMMLFGCTFTRSELSKQVRVIVSGFLSVAIAVAIGYVFFGKHIAEGEQIGGIMSGMYTGGMVNAAAIQAIFKVDHDRYMLMCSYDIIISFLYLVFLVSVGYKLFRWLYKEKRNTTLSESEKRELDEQIAQNKRNPYEGLWTAEGLQELGKIVSITVLIIGISFAATIPFDEGLFMTIFILMISTLGVACSFIKPVRNMKRSFDIGMYLIYIFSIAMASMADFSKFNFSEGVNLIYYLTIAVFGSLVLHAIFCRLMRIDADTMVVSSVSFINSPPFVPMMVAALKNKSVLIVGIGAGIVGYAVGNHFGVLMAKLLELL
jgi:uncharacterized membrane protein